MGKRGFILVLCCILPLAGACNGALRGGDNDPDSDSEDGGTRRDLGTGGNCVGLGCRVVHCGGTTTTMLSGTVNIPAGNLPLYGARVFIPNGAVAPIAHGPSCDRCDQLISGNPLVSTTTDAAGKFTLANVPSGADIPLVIQVGKWRRQITLASVPSCKETPIDPSITRLPRNQAEGDMPQIALTTGGADALECLMRKLGIDDSEITAPSGKGRVHLYSGVGGTSQFAADHGGAAIPPASPWWDQLANLKQYDVIVHSCEGQPMSTNKSMQARQALKDYLDLGGRVFASHWHNYWLQYGVAPLNTVATFNSGGVLPSPITADVEVSFDKGKALADWLVTVGGSTQLGKLVLNDAKSTIDAVNQSIARSWISVPAQRSIQYLSFDAPVGVADDQQCGRMVLSDIHVSSGDIGNLPFPNSCVTKDLSPQEKALIFMVFDLSNCLAPVIG